MYHFYCTSSNVVPSIGKTRLYSKKKGVRLVLRLRLKELAQERNLSMGALSRKSDISFNNIKKLYRDPYTNVRLSTLEQLADALGVSICDLVEKVPPR